MDTKSELPPPDYSQKQPDPNPAPSTHSDQATWDPRAAPIPPSLGTYAPQMVQQPGAHPGMNPGHPGQMVMVQQFPTSNFCPGTGGAHTPHTRAGAMGILIGILFCPIGLIAIPFDKKTQCTNCKYTIKESWGGC